MAKRRLDQLIFDKGLTESRERARTSVMAGLVYVNDQRVLKPGTMLEETVHIELRGEAVPYVSRGGLKLEKALRVFGVDPAGFVCADCGASTGGFTDVLLRAGAERVYAVDVGYGQLAWSLRCDPRVVCLERTNARYLGAREIPEPLDLATADLSFISLRLVMGALLPLLKSEGQMLCLVKPQFEAGKEQIGKKGVVRDPLVHRQVLERFSEDCQEAGFCLLGLDFSPVRGPEGNIEYLAYLKKGAAEPFTADLTALVERSHSFFEKRGERE